MIIRNCKGRKFKKKKKVLLLRLSSRSLTVGGRVNKMSSIIDSECSEQFSARTHASARAHARTRTHTD